MNGETQTGLTHVGDGDILIANFYALHLADLVEQVANLLRSSGHGLREDIADQYPPRTVDLLVSELDTHAGLLRGATNAARKDTP